MASAILNGCPPSWVEVEYPLKLDAFIRLASLCAPYQSARLSSVVVKDTQEQEEHVEFIKRLAEAAQAANERDREVREATQERLDVVLTKLSPEMRIR